MVNEKYKIPFKLKDPKNNILREKNSMRRTGVVNIRVDYVA